MEQSRKSNAFIGRAIERIEDLRLLRGCGQYVGDLAPTNALHAVVLRSNVAHGLIRQIDASRACARPFCATSVKRTATPGEPGKQRARFSRSAWLAACNPRGVTAR